VAYSMGAGQRAVVYLLLMLGLVGCTNSLSRTVVPPPTFAPPAFATATTQTRPAATTAVTTLPARATTTTVPATQGVPVRGRVVLDPGHGGKDTGAEGGGIVEKSLTLEVTLAAAEELKRQGVVVILTRRGDQFVELADRAKAANRANADLFVAIHADSNPSPAKIGHSVLLPQSGNPKARLAALWLDHNLTVAGSPSHIIRTDDRGLYVLRHIACPAILLEMGFLSNPTEASWLRDPTYRRQVAQAIANGIIEYLRRQ